MARFKIKDAQGNVINTIVASQQFVEQRYPGLWEEEIVEDIPSKKRILTHREFLKRITAQEFKSIRQAAKSNADVDMFMYLFERSSVVDLDDPDTAAGVQMLEAYGLLAIGRATEILA